MSNFLEVFQEVKLNDNDFNTHRYIPGSTGERALFRDLIEHTNLGEYS